MLAPASYEHAHTRILIFSEHALPADDVPGVEAIWKHTRASISGCPIAGCGVASHPAMMAPQLGAPGVLTGMCVPAADPKRYQVAPTTDT